MEDIKRAAQIKIKGVQTMGEDTDQTDLYTQGTFYRKNDKYYIVYDETPTTGYIDGKTTIKVVPNDKVLITRTGAVSSELIVEKGKRNTGIYGTEFGDIVIGVHGDTIDCNLDDHGGKLHLRYRVDVNSSSIGENEIMIEVESQFADNA